LRAAGIVFPKYAQAPQNRDSHGEILSCLTSAAIAFDRTKRTKILSDYPRLICIDMLNNHSFQSWARFSGWDPVIEWADPWRRLTSPVAFHIPCPIRSSLSKDDQHRATSFRRSFASSPDLGFLMTNLDYSYLSNKTISIWFCSTHTLQCDSLKMIILKQYWDCYGFSEGVDRFQIAKFWTDDICQREFVGWSFDKQLLDRNSCKRITWHEMNIRSYQMSIQGIGIIWKVRRFLFYDHRGSLLRIHSKKLSPSHISLRSLPALCRQFGHLSCVDKSNSVGLDRSSHI
jgi:hypothetical protein